MFTFTSHHTFTSQRSRCWEIAKLFTNPIIHSFIHTDIFTDTHTSSLCLLTQTWRATQSCPRGWCWGCVDSCGGRCLCACKEVGSHCFQDHPSQRGQQSNNAPSSLHCNLHHRSRHPGPGSNKTAVNMSSCTCHPQRNLYLVLGASVSKASGEFLLTLFLCSISESLN